MVGWIRADFVHIGQRMIYKIGYGVAVVLSFRIFKIGRVNMVDRWSRRLTDSLLFS